MKKKIIELGKIAITGIILGYTIKAIACVAVEVAKAKTAETEPTNETITTIRKINYADIPESVREKLEA